MVFERPRRQGQPQPPANRNQGNQGNGGDIPSPWLEHPLDLIPSPDSSASFVEYLRWMRSPDSAYKDTAKLQILQMAEENANYRDRLSQLNKRTQLIAGERNCFPVTCSWRIRVGGHRGPESILLPAFDALGIPYIPSSTIRGVARNQAILDFVAQGMTWQQAQAEVMRYFGGLDAQESDRAGKVIFLDAYPVPNQNSSSGGLSVDITNNIWQWDDSNNLTYDPNPQTFFSLNKPTFLIGIRPTERCNPVDFGKIKTWLISGLKSGIGSQVNTGYGTLITPQNNQGDQTFFQVPFIIQGQLIHSKQKFKNLREPYQRNAQGVLNRDQNNNLKPNTTAEPEVRCIAFKSMLRYWFRTFSLGVLPIGNIETLKTYLQAFQRGETVQPPAEVRALEAILFGSITPQTRGWVQFQLTEGKIVRPEAKNDRDDYGEQSGNLILSYSSEAPQSSQNAINKLCKNLTWMMFHLGGVGQGARRPCYSRQNRNPRANPPLWRGSTLIPESDDEFWELPETVQEFKRLFRQRLQAFYHALHQLTGHTINFQQPLTVGQVQRDQWTQAIDSNCRIIVCTGSSANKKPYALATLHDPALKRDQNYDADLCGKGGKPSPVWIADLDDYQVVTVFGGTQNPRQQYLQKLRDDASKQNYAQIFPFSS
ncbi:RAMP superfamily CRISPR-associated protein [Nostoc sp.]|uniref:RAMP superfamily CRISPR-associated protein n=1 Tax=Nostoc sp. TaxID=1180 RepID=UPI002FF1C2E8